MIRPILRLGDETLHRQARPVMELTEAVEALVDDMITTMHHAPGIGLAAPQIGVDARIFVVDLSVGRHAPDLHVVINPEIVERSGMQLEEEGCLSIPGFNATVARPKHVVVQGVGRDGSAVFIEGTGLLARALQHEIDHLDGCLFVDRLRGFRRRLIHHHIDRLRRHGRW